jgi:hypothetical protein
MDSVRQNSIVGHLDDVHWRTARYVGKIPTHLATEVLCVDCDSGEKNVSVLFSQTKEYKYANNLIVY